MPLNWELITSSSDNCSDSARADIHAKGFWGRQQGALFDIRVFHPNASSYCQAQAASLFCQHELEKKREYGDCTPVVNGESFAPLVFSIFGGLGKEAWLIYYPRNTITVTSRHSPGCVVHCPFPCYVLQWSPFVGAESANQ